MKTERIKFTNEDGQTLSARLEWPVDNKAHNFAVFAHCFTCTMNLHAIRYISDALTSAGFAVLRFDFTGLGSSEGEFEDTNFSSQIGDLFSACQWLRDNHRAPTLLIGHSLGGTAVLAAAAEMDNILAVATIGSPAEPVHVKNLISDKVDRIEELGKAEVNIGGRSFFIKKQFLDDLDNHALEKKLKEMRKALLILHSPQDAVVGIAEAEKIYKAAHHPKSFVTLDGADHLLSNKEDAAYVGQLISSWAGRYLEIGKSIELETNKQTVVRLGEKEDKFLTQIKMGGHQIIADEPESAGGFDAGPTPYDLLTAALGSCTAMTLRMYADHKGIDLREVKVHLTHEKRHAEDADPEKKGSKKADHIDLIIELDGKMTEKQRVRMLEIADRCPVHRTLTNAILINSSLKDN